jgi:hypothetical protein
MNASELRVGNYVMHEPTIDDWEEIRIKVGTIIQCEISPDSFEPILLTEEWLLKFGFEEKHGVFKKYMNEQIIAIGLDGSFGLYNDKSRWRIGSSFSNDYRLKYVHQLQNLYFALTGEELTIKD